MVDLIEAMTEESKAESCERPEALPIAWESAGERTEGRLSSVTDCPKRWRWAEGVCDDLDNMGSK